jgi:hypothetical protein
MLQVTVSAFRRFWPSCLRFAQTAACDAAGYRLLDCCFAIVCYCEVFRITAHRTGEQAIVTDAVEAFGRDVNEEATDELADMERHGGVAARPLDPIVLDP